MYKQTLPPKPWLLQEAKARFSEVVRRAHHDGPQHVTVRGRESVVIVASEEFSRMQASLSGQALIDAMQASPHQDIELTQPESSVMPVRNVTL